MQKRLFERIFGIGLILLILGFNPFMFTGLFFDTTTSFAFISGFKIFILGVLNLLISILWLRKVFEEKEIHILNSKIYIPILIFLLSSVISAIFAINKNQALFGYNFTLENSLVEGIFLFFFFFSFVNLIEKREQVENILRYLLVGISIAGLYSLIRYSFTTTINIEPFQYYLNNTNFTPIGHYSSLLPIVIIGFVLGNGFLIKDLAQKDSNKTVVIIDYICTIVCGICAGVLFNINSLSPQYVFLGIFILSIGLVFFFLLANNRLNRLIKNISIVLILPVLIGIGINFYYTSTKAQPMFYPEANLATNWEVTLDSLNSPQKAIIGNGQSSFANLFDKYSNDIFSQSYTVNEKPFSNFFVNSQVPGTEEARIFQSTYLLSILTSQGILGIVSFLAIFILILYFGLNKRVFEDNILGLFSFYCLIGLSLILVILRYDFIISVFFWLFAAITLIFLNENEEKKNFIKFRDFKFNLDRNFAFVFPSLITIISLGLLWSILPVFVSNYHLYNAKVAQIKQNRDLFVEEVQKAYLSNPNSDLVIREYVFTENIILFEKYSKLAAILRQSQPNQAEIDFQTSEIITIQDQAISDLEKAIKINPEEYKNYYFAGLTLGSASEYTPNLAYDESAIKYFNLAKLKNPHHADSYYQLAKIYLRQGQNTAALNSITPAINLRQQNIQYFELYGDIFKLSGNYQNALEIYSKIKELKDANPENQQLQNFYQNQNIDKDIEEVTKRLNEGNN